MKIPLTPTLLTLLISKGFRYCYSKTTCIEMSDADVCITLKPVKSAPKLKFLPKAYDTFFNISKEPQQMAQGIDGTLILLELDKGTWDNV